MQPFSAAELASIGYVDVPATERFTFGEHVCNGQRAVCKLCLTSCGEEGCPVDCTDMHCPAAAVISLTHVS